MKFAAAITLYNPTKVQLKHCLEYIDSFDQVYIMDNSENIDLSMEDFFKSPGFKYIKMNGNEGLSKAFNMVLEEESINSIEYLCTLDQDSVFSAEDIGCMKQFIGTLSKQNNKVGIVAPVIDYGWGVIKTVGFEKRERVITSGSFLNLNVIRKNNIRYDEKYFIDKFEIDFCRQLRLKGYDIIVYFGAKLIQQLGEAGSKKHSSHSALRHYYLFRNRFYFNHKFYKWSKRYLLNFLQTGRHCCSIILYESNKCEKIKELFVASADYIKGKMGKR